MPPFLRLKKQQCRELPAEFQHVDLRYIISQLSTFSLLWSM
jgi:hypothetical protein